MGVFLLVPHPGYCKAEAEQTCSGQYAWGRQPLPPLTCTPAKVASTQGQDLGRGCSAPVTAELSAQGVFCSPPQLSPWSLRAQLYRAKTEGDAGVLTPRMKSGTPSSSQLNLSMLGRSPSPKVLLPGGSRHCVAPGMGTPAHPVPAHVHPHSPVAAVLSRAP